LKNFYTAARDLPVFEKGEMQKKAAYIRQSSVLAFFWLLSIFREMVRSKCYATFFPFKRKGSSLSFSKLCGIFEYFRFRLIFTSPKG
jgi:hypothetical protein